MNCGNSFNVTNVNLQTQCNRNNLLNQSIGRRCTCEFLLESELVKKTGVLSNVGTDYIILTSINNPEGKLICPICDLKFIRFY